MKYEKELCDAGVDMIQAMQIVSQNEALYERLLKMFLKDPTYQNLLCAFEQKDEGKIAALAHALKGMSANLSMNELSRACAEVQNHYKNKETDFIDLRDLSEKYERIVSVIQLFG
ncbi:MAG: Hpt domain-containing protein [Christensenellaceae bacterium]